MPQRVVSLVPMPHVKSVTASIAFYEKLGFKVANTFVPEGHDRPTWAWLISGQANLMLTCADEPVDAGRQGVLFYLYFDDVAATHVELAAKGVSVGPIEHPFYAPKGQFRIADVDGYCLMVSHT